MQKNMYENNPPLYKILKYSSQSATRCNISRSSSPDHNGNGSSLEKMPPLPPWLTRTKDLQSASAPQPLLSQDEPRDLSPRSRQLSSSSAGEY